MIILKLTALAALGSGTLIGLLSTSELGPDVFLALLALLY